MPNLVAYQIMEYRCVRVGVVTHLFIRIQIGDGPPFIEEWHHRSFSYEVASILELQTAMVMQEFLHWEVASPAILSPN